MDWPIVKQMWLLSFINCLFNYAILHTKQLGYWANKEPSSPSTKELHESPLEYLKLGSYLANDHMNTISLYFIRKWLNSHQTTKIF